MEAGSLSIFVCTLFVFSAEGVPLFTTKPQKTFHAVQGENITLEWKYTFSKGESFRQALFVMGNLQLADKQATHSTPWIRNAYRGRLYVNITNHYTSVTLLRVKRADKGSYTLEVITNPDRDRNSSTVEISVLYLDLPKIFSTDTRPVERSDVTLSCDVSGEPMPTISWTMNGSPLDTSDNSRISFMEDNKNLIIANVNRRDSGEYQCVAQNSLGNVSSNSSTLSVQYHPGVALNPLNATKAEGENTTWSCNATGNPEPTISWIFNASHTKTNNNPRIVFSRDRQKMTITSLSRKDSGEYKCIAINNLGNASQVASLDVTYIPEITVHPKNVTKKEGDNATLNCNAMGNPVPKISWNKGGSPLGNTSSISLSADNKDLTIKNVNRVDSGEYRCVATNSLGNDTSNPAHLGVQFKPEICTVPRLIQRTEGDELSLFCNATGNPVPLISWTKNGFSLDTSNNSRINFSNKGKQLTIKNLSKRDGGVYLCVAENSLGNATSHGATLEVHFEPEVSIDGNQKQYVAKGGNIRLICWYEASPPVSEVQWRKEGTVIVRNASKLINGSRVTIPSFNESQVQLSITEASLRDEGNYTCNASNIFSSTQDTIMIIIEDKPEIAAHPHNVTTEEGHDVTLYCNATGNPAPTISWTKYGNPISNGSRIILSPSHEQLTITNVNRIDSGKYKCQAKNRVGTDTSFVSTVTVYFAPEISIPPRNVTVVKGEHVTFTCSVAGNPTPSVIWTKNGKDLDVTANSPLKLSSRKHNHSLEIAEVDLSDSGQYICVANSSQGKLSSSAATLTVQLSSEAPSFVVTVLNSTAVNVSWQVLRKEKARGAIFGYYVLYRVKRTLPWINKTVDGAETTSLLVGPLSEHTTYEFSMQVFNGNGVSNLSALVEKTTDQQKPSGPPQQVTLSGLTSKSIRITWDPVPPADRNGIIQGYKLSYQALPNGDIVTKFFNISIKQQDEGAKKTLNNLNEFTNYSIGVLAFTLYGDGPPSVAQLVQTLQDKPTAPPSNVRGNNISSTSILVEWDEVPAFDQNGIITSYNITYHSLTENHRNSTTVDFPGRQLTLIGLKEFVKYNITVSASTKIGPGPASYPIIVITDEDKPSAPPANVKGRNTSSTSILVEWGKVPSAYRNGIITSYNITYHSLTENPSDSTTVDFPGRQVTLMGLKKFVNYSITVFASTVVGNGPASDPIFVSSDEDRPSRGPENVSSREVNYTTNKITWIALPKETANGFIELYEVHLELKESCLKVDSTFHAMNTTKSSVLLTGLWMCAKYDVSVRGYTVAGPGPFSKAIVVQTKGLKLSKLWSEETPSSPTFSQTSSGEGITAKITLPRFPGNAKFFQVIVIRYSLDYTGVVNSPDSFTPKDLMTYEEAHKSSVPAAYVTFQFRGHDSDAFRKFTVGDGAHSNSKTRKRRSNDGEDFLNKPLQPNTIYRVFLRAFIDKTVYLSSNFVTIETKGKPNVKGLAERTIFQVGDVVVLTCEAIGDPKPSVTWSKDGNTNIPRAQFRNDGHILVIQEVAPRDGGIYECRASNIFGQRRTATAVIIAVPPSIRKDVSPPSVICAKDTPCTLLCHATSAIPFNYSWTRNDHALNGRNIKVVNNTLIVTPLDDQDFGDYVCHATNLFGSTTYKITLSESLEDEHNVQSIFQAGHIAWSCIVFVLLVLIGLLIRWLRRAQAINRTATAEKAIIVDAIQSALPLEQHMSEPASYMELHPRPSDGQTRVPSEYQSLQGGHVNAGYYNVVPGEANKKGPSEEIYEEIELYDC